MPNFHRNDFAIAANAEDMGKVLKSMSRNFYEAGNFTAYDGAVDGLDVEAAFKELKPYVENYFMFAFAPKPIGIGDDVQGDTIDLGDGATMTMTYAARGRAASDTAWDVSMFEADGAYVLSMNYDTAWETNTRDVIDFLKGLPDGKYGYCMLDADEYDGYETINSAAGVLKFDDEPVADGQKSRDELKSERQRYKGLKKRPESLAELAYAAALNTWPEWGFEDEDDDEEEFDSDALEDSGFDYLRLLDAGYSAPLAVALSQTIEYGLNDTWPIEGTAYLDRNAHIENVKVGDRVFVASDWKNEWFKPVCLEVFDKQGRTLGNLSVTHYGAGSHEAIAYLLPHLTATVKSVTPLSSRRKNAKYALMDVALEFDDTSFSDVIDEARALRKQAPEKRVVVSKGGLKPRDLKGNVDISQAFDCIDDAFAVEDAVSREQISGSDAFSITSVASPAATTLYKASAKATASEKIASLSYDKAPTNTRWSMCDHQRGEGTAFSVEVPDEFEVVEGLDGRVFAVPFKSECFTNDEGRRDADTSESDGFVYASLNIPMDDEARESYREHAIPELLIEQSREAQYQHASQSGLAKAVDDWVIRGENCDVLVMRSELVNPFSALLGADSDAGQFLSAIPITTESHDTLNVTVACAHENDYTWRDFESQMLRMAETIRLNETPRYELLEKIDTFGSTLGDADAFEEAVKTLAGVLKVAANNKVNNDLARLNNRGEASAGNQFERTIAEAVFAYYPNIEKYYSWLIGILETQKELGAKQADLKKMCSAVELLRNLLINERVTIEDNKDLERKVNRLKIVKVPASVAPLDDRLQALDAGWVPDSVAPGSKAAKAAEEERAKQKAVEAKREAEKAKAEAERKAKTAEALAQKDKKLEGLFSELAWIKSVLNASERTDQGKAADLAQERLRTFEQTPNSIIPEHAAQLAAADIDFRRVSAPADEGKQKLEAMRSELASMGLLAFGRKKALKEAISKQESEVARLRDAANASPERYKRDKLKDICDKEQMSIDEDWAAKRSQLAKEASDAVNAASAEKERLKQRVPLIIKELEGIDSDNPKVGAIGLAYQLGTPRVGNTITFGRYAYDRHGKDIKPLEWRVLAVEGTSVLLITKAVIDQAIFNDVKTIQTWPDCSLRKRLNGSFLERAFNKKERLLIKKVTLQDHTGMMPNWDGPHNVLSTKPSLDWVFCLSVDEANRYFASNNDRKAQATPYAQSKGIHCKENCINAEPDSEATWMLRTIVSGDCPMCAVDWRDNEVGISGYIDAKYVGLRPSLWVDLGRWI